MLGDNNQDRDQQRNQVIAIVLMTVLVVAWSYFFLPTPQPPPPQQAEPMAGQETPGQPAEAQPTAPAPAAPRPEPVRPPAADDGTPVAGIPVADPPENPADDEVVLLAENCEYVFTRVGARLKRATMHLGRNGDDVIQLVPDWGTVPDADAVYPLGLRFSGRFLGDALDRCRWDVVTASDAGASELAFSIEVPDVATVTKTIRLGEAPGVLDMEVSYLNAEEVPRLLGLDTTEPAYSLNWGPNVSSEDAHKYVKQDLVFRTGEKSEYLYTDKLDPPAPGQEYSKVVLGADWAAVRSAYFVVALKPEGFEDAWAWAVGAPEHFRVGVGVPRIETVPGETATHRFKVYLGPRLSSALAQAWPGLDSLVNIFTVWGFEPVANFMNWFSRSLLAVMNWFYASLIANYGLAIIFCTVLVRVAMYPLTLKSMRSMKRMQKLAPEIEKLKEEIGDDQQEIQKRMMELYKERGVSPLGGCFPMLLQMPVFIAFYRMLSNAFELRRAPFALWIQDLSEPDRLMELPFSIPMPFGGSAIDHFNLLPILMGLAMVVSQKLMPTSGPVQNQQQKIMMNMMPILFSAICYNMASALNLYILTSTLLGIVQNYLVHTKDDDKVPVKKTKRTAGRPKHFYAAAQARKREIAKEARRDKRVKPKRNQPRTKKSAKKRS